MKVTPASNLVFKYLSLPMGLGGRGGVQRFFFLSQGIPFEEKLYDMGDEWQTEKKRLIETNENPCAALPVTYADDTPLGQHIATCRLLGAVHGCNSGDAYLDFLQDMVADEYQGFRSAWADATFSGDDQKKEAYRKGELVSQLTKFDAIYGKFKKHDAFLSVSAKTQQPLWGDAALFGLLRDNMITGFINKEDLKSYENLDKLFEGYGKIPAVAAWVKSKENDVPK